MALSETAEKYKAQKAQLRKQARESWHRQKEIRLSKVRPAGLFQVSDFKDWMFPSNRQDRNNVERENAYNQQKHAAKTLDAEAGAVQDESEQPEVLQFIGMAKNCNCSQIPKPAVCQFR